MNIELTNKLSEIIKIAAKECELAEEQTRKAFPCFDKHREMVHRLQWTAEYD